MNINYDKKRIVAFLDVMGFKALLKPTPENLFKLTSYYEAINGIQIEDTRSIYPVPIQTDIMAVSDSIVISIPIDEKWDKETLFKVTGMFFDQLCIIQATLTLDGIWIRGAVTIGDLYIDTKRSILVGQAFVDAYNLEQEANYPRIILDPKILKTFGVSAPIFCKKLKGLNISIQDFYVVETMDYGVDDFMQLDWFGKVLDLSNIEPTPEDIDEEISELTVFFDDLTERQCTSGDIFLKTQKLLAYLQRSYWESFRRNGKKRTQVYEYVHNRLSDLTGVPAFRWDEWA